MGVIFRLLTFFTFPPTLRPVEHQSRSPANPSNSRPHQWENSMPKKQSSKKIDGEQTSRLKISSPGSRWCHNPKKSGSNGWGVSPTNPLSHCPNGCVSHMPFRCMMYACVPICTCNGCLYWTYIYSQCPLVSGWGKIDAKKHEIQTGYQNSPLFASQTNPEYNC